MSTVFDPGGTVVKVFSFVPERCTCWCMLQLGQTYSAKSVCHSIL